MFSLVICLIRTTLPFKTIVLIRFTLNPYDLLTTTLTMFTSCVLTTSRGCHGYI